MQPNPNRIRAAVIAALVGLTGNHVATAQQSTGQTTAKDLEQIIDAHTQCRVISVHSDVSTKSGEQVSIYVLDHDLEAMLPRKQDLMPRRS